MNKALMAMLVVLVLGLAIMLGGTAYCTATGQWGQPGFCESTKVERPYAPVMVRP